MKLQTAVVSGGPLRSRCLSTAYSPAYCLRLCSMSETTFVMVKPDGVARGLVGEVIGRFERKGLRLTKIRMLIIDEALARRHYAEHVERPFFPELLDFITMGPVVAMEWTGEVEPSSSPEP